jgi:hypothetical protein
MRSQAAIYSLTRTCTVEIWFGSIEWWGGWFGAGCLIDPLLVMMTVHITRWRINGSTLNFHIKIRHQVYIQVDGSVHSSGPYVHVPLPLMRFASGLIANLSPSHIALAAQRDVQAGLLGRTTTVQCMHAAVHSSNLSWIPDFALNASCDQPVTFNRNEILNIQEGSQVSYITLTSLLPIHMINIILIKINLHNIYVWYPFTIITYNQNHDWLFFSFEDLYAQ